MTGLKFWNYIDTAYFYSRKIMKNYFVEISSKKEKKLHKSHVMKWHSLPQKKVSTFAVVAVWNMSRNLNI